MNDFFLFIPMVRSVKPPHSDLFLQEVFVRASCVPGDFVRYTHNSKMNEVGGPIPQGACSSLRKDNVYIYYYMVSAMCGMFPGSLGKLTQT